MLIERGQDIFVSGGGRRSSGNFGGGNCKGRRSGDGSGEEYEFLELGVDVSERGVVDSLAHPVPPWLPWPVPPCQEK